MQKNQIKLIITLAIYAIGEFILELMKLDRNKLEQLLKGEVKSKNGEYILNLGEFENILKIIEEGTIKIDEECKNIINIIKLLHDLSKEKTYNLILDIPEIVRWDIKGVDLCLELAQRLYDAINYERNNPKNKDVEDYLKIFSERDRKHLKKSYIAGWSFYGKLHELRNNTKVREEFRELLTEYIKRIGSPNDMGIKFVVWDWIAGMTDSYILREYESFTFKKLDLK